MHLSKIIIENFRCFGSGPAAFHLALRPGLTALVGENDSGKTVIPEAARAEGESRAHRAGWIPWRGTIVALRARSETARFAADAERARTALAHAAKPARQ